MRDTSPHPTHDDSSTINRQQPVAGTLDTSNADEQDGSEECDDDSPPTDDPQSDGLSEEEAVTEQPANPLLPDYPVLLLKNLYSDKKPSRKSAQESAFNEPPADLSENDEVFGDREGANSLGVGDGEGDCGKGENTNRSARSRRSTVEDTPALSAFGIPKFLHIRVCCESDTTFSPLVHGMSIPGRHFKDDFWFAVPEDR